MRPVASVNVDPVSPIVCRRIRQRAGWRQRQVAELGGVHQTTVSRVERGRIALRPDTRRRFLAVLAILSLGHLVAVLSD